MVKEFTNTKKFTVGPCDMKGQDEYCHEDRKSDTGYFNYVKCPVKSAFFSIVAATNGYLERRVAEDATVCSADGKCPGYVEWAIPWKGKTEYIAITKGGQLSGIRKDEKGPCAFFEMKTTNPEMFDILSDLFNSISENPSSIGHYLEKKFNIPYSEIKDRALEIASHPNKPRIVE